MGFRAGATLLLYLSLLSIYLPFRCLTAECSPPPSCNPYLCRCSSPRSSVGSRRIVHVQSWWHNASTRPEGARRVV
jgi:hypothetical protein